MRYNIYKGLKEIYNKFFNSTKPASKAHTESIHALVNLTEARDPYTKRHSVKVSNYAALLAECIGVEKRDIEAIRLAAILHDIGKIGVRKKVLLKNSSLTRKEYEEVKKHSEIGAEIARPLKFFKEVILMIKHHHESYDGTGYPGSLKGENIPLGSRILAIADSYDALTNKRAYRKAYSTKKALQIMKSENRKKFDPALFKTFVLCISSRKKALSNAEPPHELKPTKRKRKTSRPGKRKTEK